MNCHCSDAESTSFTILAPGLSDLLVVMRTAEEPNNSEMCPEAAYLESDDDDDDNEGEVESREDEFALMSARPRRGAAARVKYAGSDDSDDENSVTS